MDSWQGGQYNGCKRYASFDRSCLCALAHTVDVVHVKGVRLTAICSSFFLRAMRLLFLVDCAAASRIVFTARMRLLRLMLPFSQSLPDSWGAGLIPNRLMLNWLRATTR